MQFVFTEEQQMMTEMAIDFLGAHCKTDALRKLADAGQSFDPDRWSALADLGLIGALVSEEAGGLGLGPADMIGIATACGAALLPEPLVDTMAVSLPALEKLGQWDLIGSVVSGQVRVAVSHPQAPLVEGADGADFLLVFAPDRIALISDKEAVITAQPGIDPLRRLFSVAPGTSAQTLATGDEAATISAEAGDAGALFAAAQLLGIAQRAVDLSVAYAIERQQFGKPIGVNQAIKHHLASAQVAVEFARPVLHAASAVSPAMGPAGAARISHAKVACGRAADLATRIAIQVHGGMGYTMETDVHLYLKRALGLRSAWGTQTYHHARYASNLSAARFGPDTLFPQESSHA